MTRLDWEKAARRDKQKRDRPGPKQRNATAGKRHWEMTKFVVKHDLKCFVCNTVKAEWAKTGFTKKRVPWALCLDCARRKKKRP